MFISISPWTLNALLSSMVSHRYGMSNCPRGSMTQTPCDYNHKNITAFISRIHIQSLQQYFPELKKSRPNRKGQQMSIIGSDSECRNGLRCQHRYKLLKPFCSSELSALERRLHLPGWAYPRQSIRICHYRQGVSLLRRLGRPTSVREPG